ncbi:MAG: hypothetical protein C0404_07600, partial [Verrucomicrobia bacterium]|nr:hypothetical protein [Verrucomicrobiota bacterium]
MPDKLQIELHKPGQPPKLYPANLGIYTIGSDDDCKIVLQHSTIESRHAILIVQDDSISIEDLSGPAGTIVDGSRIKGRIPLRPDQRVDIGPYAFYLRIPPQVFQAPPPVHVAQPPPAAPQIPAPAPAPESPPAFVPPRATIAPTPAPLAPQQPLPAANISAPLTIQQRRMIKQQIHRQLVERLDIKRMTASRVDKDELRDRALKTLRGIVGEISAKLPVGLNPEALIKEVYDEAIGLGPLEDLLEDPDVTEIMVNGPNQVYVEKKGKILATDKSFMDDSSVLAIIERIVAPLGRRIDESQPYVDARLSDGSRVNAIIHPLSLIGPCLTIRKFSKVPFTDRDLIRFGTITPSIAEFTQVCVLFRKNIVVSGGTGSGKTTLLNVLSSYLPETDRIITIEDAAELRLNQSHVVRLEARPPNIEGKGAIAIRDLVRNALRMRPDRIVVG